MNDLQSLDTDTLAKIIWEYHHMHQPLQKVDCIIALGSNDIRVAERAAKLFLESWAPLFVVSGADAHKNDILDTGYGMSEAEKFAEVAISLGVPVEKIFIEDHATNTGDNCKKSIQMLHDKGYDPQSFLLVQKPYMERRTYATFKQIFPQYEAIVSSPQVSYEEWMNGPVSKENVINLMIGDLQRIKMYPEKGFQIYQEILDDVWAAYEELLVRGYTKHLIKDEELYDAYPR